MLMTYHVHDAKVEFSRESLVMSRFSVQVFISACRWLVEEFPVYFESGARFACYSDIVFLAFFGKLHLLFAMKFLAAVFQLSFVVNATVFAV